jgi:hypothetical protein
MDDDTGWKEYAGDVPFVERRCNRPAPSFCIGCNVFARYFLTVRSTNGDFSPFWVASVVTNLNPDSGHCNQIHLLNWKPNSFEDADVDTYIEWDLKKGNVWYVHKGLLPCWSYIDCVIIAWKSRVHSGIVDPKMRILAKQISIIMASLETYESHSDSK